MTDTGRIDEEAIRRRAYQIWEREGRPQGQAQAHWLAARVELASESGSLPDPDLPGSPGGAADGTESSQGSRPFSGGPMPSGE